MAFCILTVTPSSFFALKLWSLLPRVDEELGEVESFDNEDGENLITKEEEAFEVGWVSLYHALEPRIYQQDRQTG